MSQVECVQKSRLLAEFEIAMSEYAGLRNKSGPAFDFGRTVLLRSRLDRVAEEITGHCVEHGCDPDWIRTRLDR